MYCVSATAPRARGGCLGVASDVLWPSTRATTLTGTSSVLTLRVSCRDWRAVLPTPIRSALLDGAGSMDRVTFAAVSIGLGGVTLLATYLPACRR